MKACRQLGNVGRCDGACRQSSRTAWPSQATLPHPWPGRGVGVGPSQLSTAGPSICAWHKWTRRCRGVSKVGGTSTRGEAAGGACGRPIMHNDLSLPPRPFLLIRRLPADETGTRQGVRGNAFLSVSAILCIVVSQSRKPLSLWQIAGECHASASAGARPHSRRRRKRRAVRGQDMLGMFGKAPGMLERLRTLACNAPYRTTARTATPYGASGYQELQGSPCSMTRERRSTELLRCEPRDSACITRTPVRPS